MPTTNIVSRKQLLFNLFLIIIQVILVLALVPAYIIAVIKIAGLTGILSASRGVLTLFVINFVFQVPIYLYNILVLRKQKKELTTAQIDKIKIFSTLIATTSAFLLNHGQLAPILYFAAYLLASNRIAAYLYVKFNLSKIQQKLTLFVMDLLFILLGSVHPAIKSGVVPLLIFGVLLGAVSDGASLVLGYVGKRSEQIKRDATLPLP